MVVNPTTPLTLYAGTSNGVYKSTNGGTTWNGASTDLTNTYVCRHARRRLQDDQQRRQLGAMNNGLSTNLRFLAIDPHNPAIVYAGTANGGVYRSENGAASWSAFNTGLANPEIHDLDVTTNFPPTLYAGSWGGGVFARTTLAAGIQYLPLIQRVP